MPSKPRPQRPATLPERFQPKFWENADQRQAVIRTIRQRRDELSADTGADSVQKQMLVDRAVFLALRLETMEVDAAEGGDFPAGHYSNMVNVLTGVLKALGLERKVHSRPWEVTDD